MPFGVPDSGLQAKFSLPFIVACALLQGRVGLAEVSDDGARDPALRALAERVAITTTDAADPEWRDAAPSDAVAVIGVDGTRHTAPPLRRWRGHADNPMGEAELREKFMDCTRYAAVAESDAARLFETLRNLPALPNAAAITGLLPRA
jgi:2-methylcitrate dehydratase PrpD